MACTPRTMTWKKWNQIAKEEEEEHHVRNPDSERLLSQCKCCDRNSNDVECIACNR